MSVCTTPVYKCKCHTNTYSSLVSVVFCGEETSSVSLKDIMYFKTHNLKKVFVCAYAIVDAFTVCTIYIYVDTSTHTYCACVYIPVKWHYDEVERNGKKMKKLEDRWYSWQLCLALSKEHVTWTECSFSTKCLYVSFETFRVYFTPMQGHW